jgi:protein-S-isoprenylcysteine O-methyltransferase Ste14
VVRNLELKIPPAVLVALAALAMWGLAEAFPALRVEIPGRRWWVRGFFGVGVALVVLGAFEFLKARTTVDPHRPQKATRLVTGGIYRLTRNPMYLGMLLGLVGWAFALSNLLSFLPPPLFVLAMNRLQIGPEERFMREKFGDEYRAFSERVRRWI